MLYSTFLVSRRSQRHRLWRAVSGRDCSYQRLGPDDLHDRVRLSARTESYLGGPPLKLGKKYRKIAARRVYTESWSAFADGLSGKFITGLAKRFRWLPDA